MKHNYSLLILLFCIFLVSNSNKCLAQNGPGGVGSDTDNRFWFIANSLTASKSDGATVNSVTNYGGNTLNATQSTTSRRPIFSTNQINGFPIIEFDGTNDYLSIADNSDLDTGGPWAQRTYSVVIRTGADVTTRQNIYNEGGATRGINIYIDNGNLYIGALNLNNDGADAPWGFTSANTTISANTNYIVSFTFDANTSMTGTIDTYLNGALFGTLTGIGRIYNHNPANFGAQVNDGYYHDGADSDSNYYYSGGIAEFIFYNKVLNDSELNSLHNYLSSKYDINISGVDNYSYDSSADNFDYHYISIQRQSAADNHLNTAEGTGIITIEENDALADNDYLAIATNEFENSNLESLSYGCSATNKTLYKLTSNWRAQKSGTFSTSNFTLNLDDFGPSFTSEEVTMLVSSNSSFSSPTEINATSVTSNIANFENVTINDGDYISFAIAKVESADIVPGGVSTLLNTRFWYQSESLDLTNNSTVTSWENQGSNGLPFNQATNSNRPIFLEDQTNGFPALIFDGTNDLMKIDNNDDINLSEPYSSRTFSMVFNSGSDISSTQVLYQEGGSTRSLQFFIKGGNLYYAGYNDSNDGAGSPWSYTSASTPILANTDYVLSYVYKGNSTTTGTIECYLNGSLVGTINNIGLLYTHTGDITIGGNGNNTLLIDGSTVGTNSNYFEGSITEFAMYDESLNTAQIGILHNYYASKYDLALTANDLYAYDSSVEGDFDYNLVGIYDNSSDIKSQSYTGTGIVYIDNASNLDAGEHLTIASNFQDSNLLNTNDINCSSTLPDDQTLASIWRVDESGDVGTVNLNFVIDQISLSSSNYSSVELLISSSSDFSSATTTTGTISCNTLTFTGVNLTDGDYFTLNYSDVQPITWDGTDYANGSGTNEAPSTLDQGRKLVILNPSATLTESASVGCFHIASGADVTISSGVELAVQQDIYNLGNLDASEANITLDGNQTQEITGKSLSFGELEVNNTNGVTINLDADEVLYIDSILRVTDGNLNTGNALYMRCDFTNGAAQIDEVGGSISGNITTEQCFPAKRAFRFIASSVTTSTYIRDNWQEGVNNLSNTVAANQNPNPGYGTHITGSMTGANGFDATTSGNPSLFELDNINQTWVTTTNTNSTTLTAGYPYRIMIRGDRSVDVLDNETSPTDTRLRNTGTVATGNVNFSSGFSSTEGHFNFFGNPYHAIVDMTQVLGNVSTSNVNTLYYYIWDPTVGTRGSYSTIDVLTNTGTNGDGNKFIMPMQAGFFLTADQGTTPTLAFTEANKNVNQTATSVFRPANSGNESFLQLHIYQENLFNAGDQSSDGLKIKFQEYGDDAFTYKDAPKMFNLDENIARNINGEITSIEVRSYPEISEVLPLYISTYRTVNYVFEAQLEGLEEYDVYLKDNYLNQSTLLTNGSTYSFQVNFNQAGDATLNSDRFELMMSANNLSVDEDLAQVFQLFPNPTSSILNVKWNSTETIASILIYDNLGRTVKEIEATENFNHQINLAELNTGLYVIQVNTINGKTFTQKIVKE